MSRIHSEFLKYQSASQDEAAALLFENEELRRKAAELLLETSILREALSAQQPKVAAGAPVGAFKIER